MQVERQQAPTSVGVLASGERVSNAWVIYPWVWNNLPKGELMPDKFIASPEVVRKGLTFG